jgi:hypothetical protein
MRKITMKHKQEKTTSRTVFGCHREADCAARQVVDQLCGLVIRPTGGFVPVVSAQLHDACHAPCAGKEATRKLVEWLTPLGICLIAADELRHETFQKDREQTGLAAGDVREVMGIALEVTQPALFMVRLHRRHGTTDRLLPQDEIQVGRGDAVVGS